ncbi:glutamate racemase [Helicobacter sp. 23-1045]
MKIGVFDSGVGGLSVLKSLLDSKLFSEIIYYGDTARVPYGNKDKATIVRFSLECVDFFIPHKIDMLIVGCNTVSAYALDEMQKIAPFPVIGVVESGVLSISNKIQSKNAKILIIATKATTESGIYEKHLRKLGYENLVSLQTGLFVPLVEEGILSGEILEATFRYYFGNRFRGESAPEAIILACTHFPLIASEIRAYFENKPILIHSGEAIVEFLKQKYITDSAILQTPKVYYYASGDKKALESTAKLWLKS